MASGSFMALLFISALFTVLSLSLLWFWLDYQEKKRADWTRMRSPHLHHVLLWCWPWVLTGLVVVLNGQVSDQLIWCIILLTGIFLYSAGLWDLRFERVGVGSTKVEVSSALLIRLAFRYPFGETIGGIFGIALGLPMLFFGSFASLSSVRIVIACGSVVVLSFIMLRLVKIWDGQKSEQRSKLMV